MKSLVLIVLLLLSTATSFAIKKITVAQDGSGDYTTVQAAIDAVPDNNASFITIYIKKGIYKERITISKSKSFINLVGEDAKKTILTYDNYASKKDSTGRDLGTTRTASIFIHGNDITAENITFENSSGPVGQAVAVLITGDRVAFKYCLFLGFQDTLYTKGDKSRQYYLNCYIEGTVDFIFGASTAVFDHCVLYSKDRGGFVTAASTPEGTKYGYVFLQCRLTGNAPNESVMLGRPWRPFAKVVYISCDMGPHIKVIGWQNWDKTNNDQTAYYAEYHSKGKGANTTDRISWSHQLNDDEAKSYTLDQVFPDWQPFAGK